MIVRRPARIDRGLLATVALNDASSDVVIDARPKNRSSFPRVRMLRHVRRQSTQSPSDADGTFLPGIGDESQSATRRSFLRSSSDVRASLEMPYAVRSAFVVGSLKRFRVCVRSANIIGVLIIDGIIFPTCAGARWKSAHMAVALSCPSKYGVTEEVCEISDR